MSGYAEFLASKRLVVQAHGPTVDPGDIHPALFPFQRDLVRWSVRKGCAALFADCVAGDTIINTPDGDERIDVLARQGEPIRVWSLAPDGRVVAATASAPFRKGVAALFQFTLQSGRSITVTKGHRFLTPTGWRFASEIAVGSRLAVASHSKVYPCEPCSSCGGFPAIQEAEGAWPTPEYSSSLLGSISGCVLSTSPLSVRYFCEKPADSMDYYSVCSRRYGPQPHPAPDSAQALAPSQDDVPGHAQPSLHEGGRGHRRGCNHHHQDTYLPSMMDSCRQAVSVGGGGECQTLSSASKPSLWSNHTASPVLPYASPGPSVHESHPWVDTPCEAFQFAPFSPSWDTLVSIDYITTDTYFDMHVPTFGNYLANGVWNHNTGLGKTPMQLEWARLTGERTLILAPLSVARQTVNEGKRLLGLEVHYTRSGNDLSDGINITNYEMLDQFDPADFGAVVLDESSILKSLDGKTRTRLTELFANTPYRLCCTATPAPNDIAEIANHAEFLGVMTRANMLATFFVHDSDTSAHGGWRLKKHAEVPFYRWLASWGMSIRKPSDLGYSDEGYDLPPLEVKPVFIKTDYAPDVNGQQALIPMGLKGITDRAKVRRGTIRERVQAAAEIVNADRDQWIVWCGMNEESAALGRLISGAVEVKGSDDSDEKGAAMEVFQAGRHRVLVTKPRIAGFGMNFQHAHKMVFVGLSDSWEAYYQCIRRCYRFGQAHPVEVYIVLSDQEEPIYQNVLRKEAEAKEMAEQLIANVQQFEREEMAEAGGQMEYAPQVPMRLPAWLGKGA